MLNANWARLLVALAAGGSDVKLYGKWERTCIATAVEDSARPPPRMMAPGPCTAASAVTVAAMAAVDTSTCMTHRYECERTACDQADSSPSANPAGQQLFMAPAPSPAPSPSS